MAMNPMMKKSMKSVAALTAALLVAGCAPPYAGGPYYRGPAQRAQWVEPGIVESVRPVGLQGPDSGVGTLGGAALGGWAGSGIGSGGGNAAAIVGGVILGSLLGNAIERDASRRPGVEITVRLDAGRMIAVVQDAAGEPFRPGDRIRVVSDGPYTRVAH
jgi:outer membrane lipoprotein SlyB